MFLRKNVFVVSQYAFNFLWESVLLKFPKTLVDLLTNPSSCFRNSRPRFRLKTYLKLSMGAAFSLPAAWKLKLDELISLANPFVPNAPLLCPLKTLGNLTVF